MRIRGSDVRRDRGMVAKGHSTNRILSYGHPGAGRDPVAMSSVIARASACLPCRESRRPEPLDPSGMTEMREAALFLSERLLRLKWLLQGLGALRVRGERRPPRPQYGCEGTFDESHPLLSSSRRRPGSSGDAIGYCESQRAFALSRKPETGATRSFRDDEDEGGGLVAGAGDG